ncbi:hypothetical protein MMA231_03026 [Asticcacaulis sp. MM231]|uniref:hypothetical protein n=1 Tax=Asticcacaulis sp. MM231 TaxID=3157666 RepID=UPI0032D56ABD
MMKRRILLFAITTALASPAFGQDEDDFDPSTVRIADLIECKADVPTYNGVAFWMNSDEAPEHPLGMTMVESGNPFVSQYELDAPIEVFGYTTQIVVFTNSGPMAVLDTPDAAAVAKALEIKPAYVTEAKFMGERIISETEESEGDFKWKTKISLNVSNVDSHPGKTLAGCSYGIDME